MSKFGWDQAREERPKPMKRRRYGCWAGNPNGQPEDPSRCVKSVYPSGTRSFIPAQCARKRGCGPNGEYCAQHAKKVKERQEAKTKLIREDGLL